MNELEKHIIKHRKDFDLYDPSPAVWQRIEKDLEAPEQTRKSRRILPLRWWAAAAVAIALGSFFFLRPTEVGTATVDLRKINPSYAMQIEFAQEDINERQSQIMSLVQEYPALAKKFQADLVALDVTYEKLRDNLFQEQNQEMLLKAMIANLKLQISVLEDQLELLENLKSTIDENSGDII